MAAAGPACSARRSVVDTLPDITAPKYSPRVTPSHIENPSPVPAGDAKSQAVWVNILIRWQVQEGPDVTATRTGARRHPCRYRYTTSLPPPGGYIFAGSGPGRAGHPAASRALTGTPGRTHGSAHRRARPANLRPPSTARLGWASSLCVQVMARLCSM